MQASRVGNAPFRSTVGSTAASAIASHRQHRRTAQPGSCPGHASGSASAELSHIESPMLWPYNDSFIIQSATAMKAQWQMVEGRKLGRLCPGEVERELPRSGGTRATGRATCADDGAIPCSA